MREAAATREKNASKAHKIKVAKRAGEAKRRQSLLKKYMIVRNKKLKQAQIQRDEDARKRKEAARLAKIEAERIEAERLQKIEAKKLTDYKIC